MAGFGGSKGSKERPATPRQRDYLESLLRDAGYASFADARHPLGLTQRQSNGRFSAVEASALIDALLQAQRDGTSPSTADRNDESDAIAQRAADTLSDQRASAAAVRLDAERARQLRGMPAELLADELRSRGWTVTEPS